MIDQRGLADSQDLTTWSITYANLLRIHQQNIRKPFTCSISAENAGGLEWRGFKDITDLLGGPCRRRCQRGWDIARLDQHAVEAYLISETPEVGPVGLGTDSYQFHWIGVAEVNKRKKLLTQLSHTPRVDNEALPQRSPGP